MAFIENSNDDKSLQVTGDRPAVIQGRPGEFAQYPERIPEGYRISADNVNLEPVPLQEQDGPALPMRTSSGPLAGDVSGQGSTGVGAPVSPVPVENVNVVIEDVDQGDSFFFSSAQAAEEPSEPVKKVPSVMEVIHANQVWSSNINVSELNERLSSVGIDQFTKDLNHDIDMLAAGVSEKGSTYDPPPLQPGESDQGKVWHYGIPLEDWRATTLNPDPKDGSAPEQELVFARRKELLRNRLVELGIGESIYGKNILANASPGLLETEEIGWNGSNFYTQPTIGERIVTELENTATATARGVVLGIPDALISINELGGMAMVAVGQGPEVAVAQATTAITDVFKQLAGMPEDDAISYSQRKTEEFLQSLQLVGEENQMMRDWLQKQAYNTGLTDLIGERLSGGTLGARVVEEAIPFLITMALPIAKATELIVTSKSLKIAQRLMMDRGQSTLLAVDNRVAHLRSNLGKLTGDQKLELINLQNQQRLLRDVTPKQRAYRDKWATKNLPGSASSLTATNRAEIANIEFALELGASGGLALSAAAFGEDHWMTMLSPLLGGLVAVHNTGRTVEGIGNKTLYSVHALEYVAHRGLDMAGVVGSQERMTRTAIKMFGMQDQAKAKMKKKAMEQARAIYEIEGEGKLKNSDIAARVLKNNAEHDRLNSVPNRTALQEIRLADLKQKYIPLDGSNWEAELTGLDFGELTAIVSSRPAQIKKLQRSAAYLIQSMPTERERIEFSEKMLEVRKMADELEAQMKARGIVDADGQATIAMYVDNFVQSSALGAMQKQLLSTNSSGMAFNISKRLKLWSTYFKMKKRQDQTLANLKSFMADVLDPIDANKVTDDLKRFKASVEKSLDLMSKDRRVNDNRATKMLQELPLRMLALLRNKEYMKAIEDGLTLRGLLRLDKVDDAAYVRQRIREINIHTAEYLERAAEKHTELYAKLTSSAEWSGGISLETAGKNILELINDDAFFPLDGWQRQAGVKPKEEQLVQLVTEARKQTLYKLMGGSQDTLQNGRPVTFANTGELYKLVDSMLEAGDHVGDPINIIANGSKQKTTVLTQARWNNVQDAVDKIKNRKAVDKDGVPLTGQDLANFKKKQAGEEAGLLDQFIDELVYVPSDRIPMEVSLSVLDQVRSNMGIVAHRNIHNRTGIRMLKMQDALDTAGDTHFEKLDAENLTGKPAELLQIWKEARAAYREYKLLMAQPFEAHAAKKGKQQSVYTSRMSEITDEAGDIDLQKVSLFNSWEKSFIIPKDHERTSEAFIKAFANPESGEVPVEVLSLLLDSVAMHINKGNSMPAGWWSSYRGIFEKSALDLEDYGKHIEDWDDFKRVFEQTQVTKKHGLDIDNVAHELAEADKAWQENIKLTASMAAKELADIGKKLDTAESRTILSGIEQLLSPTTSESGLEYVKAIEMLFSRNPERHLSRKIYGGINIDPEETIDLRKVENWPNQFGEGAQNIIDTYLGKYARSQSGGESYVPPIENLLDILDDAVRREVITSQDRENVVNVIRNQFSKYVAYQVFKKANFKSTIKDGVPAETVDILALHEIVENQLSTLNRLYDADDARLIKSATSMLHDIAGTWRQLDTTKGIPQGMLMESALARGFAITRGVVSWRWVLGEQSIRQYRKQSLAQLENFLSSPDSMRIIENVLSKNPDLITKADRNAWVKSFSHLLPGTMAKNLTLEALREQSREYQEEVKQFKQANQIPPDYKFSIGYGEPGLASTVGNIHKLRAEMERLESRRRGATPATDQSVLEERAAERAGVAYKHGGRLESQMQRLIN